MVVLGIDPGYGLIGYGVLDKTGNKIAVLDYGAISTPKDMPMSKRLEIIYDSMLLLIDRYKPSEVAIEKLYWGRNITTAIPVAQARGVIILALQQRGVKIFEYTPLQAKLAIVGYGRAIKTQVKDMVKQVLNLEQMPKLDDTTDALAIAVCHTHSCIFNDFVNKS